MQVLAYIDAHRLGYVLHSLMVAQHLQLSPFIQRYRKSLRFKTAPFGKQPHAGQVLCHVLRLQFGPVWRWELAGLQSALRDV